MKLLIFFFFIVIQGLRLYAQNYITIDEYLKLHPEQKRLMEKLDSIVQKEAAPISKSVNKVKIAILYPGGQLSDYWRRSQKSFEMRLKELKIPYEIHLKYFNEMDMQNIKKDMVDILNGNYDYFIFTLDLNLHKKMLNQILKMDKPKVILQNITTPLVEWENKQPFLYVGFDHIEGTKLLADYFKRKFPKNSKFLMLYFIEGYVSAMRGDYFIKLMADKHKMISAFFTDGKKDRAEKVVLEFSKIGEIDYIYSCSTDVSIGAYEALAKLGLKDKIALNGWGGGDKELEMILKKQLDVTVMRMNDDNGVAMAEAIKLDLLGEDVPTIYSGKFVLVDKDTTAEKINRLKEKAFRYSK